MKRIIPMMCIVLILTCLTGCSDVQVKSNLTPDLVAAAYAGGQYSTWCHTISDESKDAYDYWAELKVYNANDESRDYIMVYFFTDADEAEKYVKEYKSKSSMTWLFSVIMGEATKVVYDRYEYIVVESYKSDTAKSRKSMIDILKNEILQ